MFGTIRALALASALGLLTAGWAAGQQTLVWDDGESGDDGWSRDDNWSPDESPEGDDLVFDGTTNTDSVAEEENFGTPGPPRSVRIQSAHTANITFGESMTVGTGSGDPGDGDWDQSGGVVDLAGFDPTFEGDFSLSGGSFDLNAGAPTLEGVATISSGSFDLNGGVANFGAGLAVTGGTWTDSGTPADPAVVFAGDGDWSGTGVASFGSVQVASGATVTLQSDVTVDSLDLDGTLVTNGHTVTVTSGASLVVTGSWDASGGGGLTFSGGSPTWTSADDVSYGDVDLNTPSDVDLTGVVLAKSVANGPNAGSGTIIVQGNVNGLAASPNDSDTGATATYTLSFTTDNDLLDDAQVVITFPADTGLGSASATWTAGGDGDLDESVASETLTLTRSNSPSTIASGTPLTIEVSGVTNPTAVGDYSVTLETRTSGGTTIDGPASSSPDFTIDGGPLTGLSVDGAAATDLETGAAGVTYTVSFTTQSDLPADGRIEVTFPNGFALGGVDVANESGLSGSLNATDSGQTVILTRSGASDDEPGAVSFDLTGIDNDTTANVNQTASVRTTDSGGTTIDGATTDDFVLDGGPLTSVTASPDSSETGAVGVTYTIQLTTQSDLPADGEIEVVFPPGFNVAGVGVANEMGLTGTLDASASSQTVTLTRDSGALDAAGAFSFDLTGITNSTVVASNYTVQVETNESGGTIPIDDQTASGTFSLAGGPLTSVMVTPDDDATGATGVTYSIQFDTQSTLPSDGEIEVTFPGGFGVGGVGVTNESGATGTLNASANGQVVTLTRSSGADDGPTTISFDLTGIDNNTIANAAQNVSIRTTTTGAGATLDGPTDGSFALDGGPLTSVTASPDDAAAGATATYTVGFTTQSTIPEEGWITVTFPGGFDVSGAGVNLVSGIGGTATVNVDLQTVEVQLDAGGGDSAAGAKTIEITGVVNTSSIGDYAVDVATLESGGGAVIDDSAASSPDFTITGGALQSVSVSPGDDATGATNVTYTIGFTTVADIPDMGRLEFTFPSGFDVSGASISGVPTGVAGPFTVTTTTSTITVARDGGGGVAAPGAKEFVFDGIDNNTIGVTSQDVAIETQDSGGGTIDGPTSGSFSLVGGPLGSLSVSADDTDTGATGVTYTVTFTTQSTLPADGLIEFTFPADYVVSGAGEGTTMNVDGNIDVSFSGQVVTFTRNGGGATDTAPGPTLSFEVTGIENNTVALTAQPISVRTATGGGTTIDGADSDTVTLDGGPLQGVTASPGVDATGAANVTYTVQFDTQSTIPADGLLVFDFPGGFDASGAGVGTVSGIDGAFTVVAGAQTVTLTRVGPGNTDRVPADGPFSIQITGVDNSTVVDDTYVVSVETRSGGGATIDGATASGPFELMGGALTSIVVTPGDDATGAPNVTYTVDFDSQSTLPDDGQITFTFPSGFTVAGAGGSLSSAGAGALGVTVSDGGQTVTFTRDGTGGATAPDSFTATITGIANSDTAGSQNLAIATLEGGGGAIDGPTNGTFSLAGGSITASVSPADATASATTDYLIELTTQSTLPGNGRIVVTFPSGFDVGGITGASSPDGSIPGSFNVSDSGQTVTVARSGGGGDVAPGTLQLQLADVENTDTVATYFLTDLQTQQPSTALIDGPSNTGTFDISGGALTNVSDSPTSDATGATTTHTVELDLNSTLPDDGRIEVTFPGGFDVTGVSNGGEDLTGTVTVADLGGGVVRITRQNDGSDTSGGSTVTLMLDGIVNETVVGSYTVDVQTFDSGGTTIDGPTTSAAFSLVGGPLLNVVVSPGDDATAATNVTYTVDFELQSTLPADGRVEVTFPSGFDVSGVGAGIFSGIDGGITVTDQGGGVVRIARDGGGNPTDPGGVGGLSFQLTGIGNSAVATTHTASVETAEGDGDALDGPTNDDFDLVGGPLANVTATPGDATASATTDYTIAFTPQSTIPDDAEIVVTFPAGFDVTGVSNPSASGIDGGFSVSDSGQSVIIGRNGAGNPTAPAAVSVSFDGIVNQSVVAANYTVDVRTRENGGGATIDGPTTSGTFAIIGGPLTNVTAALSDDRTVAASVTYTLDFETSSTLPDDGRLEVVFPGGFTVPANPTVTSPGGGIDGTFAVSVSGQTVTVTRNADGTDTGAGALDLAIGGITNAETVADYDLALETQDSVGATLDGPTNIPFSLVGGALTAVTAAPGDTATSATNVTYTVQFTTRSTLPADGRVEVVFPADFGVGGAGVGGGAGTTIPGTFAVGTGGTTVTVTRQNDGGDLPPGTYSIEITGITNGPDFGAHTVDVATQQNGGGAIDGPTTSGSFDLVGGPLQNVTVGQATGRAGRTERHVISFDTQTTIPADGSILLTYPAQFDLTALANASPASGIDGTFSVSVVGQDVTLTRTSGTDAAPGTISINLDDVNNPDLVGSFTVTNVTTRNSTPSTLDGPTDSGSFDVIPDVPDHVEFRSQPTDAGINEVIGGTPNPDVEVVLVDQFGNLNDEQDGDDVEMTVQTGPGTLGGTTTQALAGGVATFDDLTLDQAADGYVLRAEYLPGGLPGAGTVPAPADPDLVDSNAFNIGLVRWIGVTDNRWDEPTNYDTGVVPGANDALRFEGAPTFSPQAGPPPTLSAIDIQATYDGTVEIPAGETLTVNNDLSDADPGPTLVLNARTLNVGRTLDLSNGALLPVGAATVNADSLTIDATSSLTVAAGGTVDVAADADAEGTIQLTGGTLSALRALGGGTLDVDGTARVTLEDGTASPPLAQSPLQITTATFEPTAILELAGQNTLVDAGYAYGRLELTGGGAATVTGGNVTAQALIVDGTGLGGGDPTVIVTGGATFRGASALTDTFDLTATTLRLEDTADVSGDGTAAVSGDVLLTESSDVSGTPTFTVGANLVISGTFRQITGAPAVELTGVSAADVTLDAGPAQILNLASLVVDKGDPNRLVILEGQGAFPRTVTGAAALDDATVVVRADWILAGGGTVGDVAAGNTATLRVDVADVALTVGGTLVLHDVLRMGNGFLSGIDLELQTNARLELTNADSLLELTGASGVGDNRLDLFTTVGEGFVELSGALVGADPNATGVIAVRNARVENNNADNGLGAEIEATSSEDGGGNTFWIFAGGGFIEALGGVAAGDGEGAITAVEVLFTAAIDPASIDDNAQQFVLQRLDADGDVIEEVVGTSASVSQDRDDGLVVEFGDGLQTTGVADLQVVYTAPASGDEIFSEVDAFPANRDAVLEPGGATPLLDGAAPVLVGATPQDVNGNGAFDRLVGVFSEPVQFTSSCGVSISGFGADETTENFPTNATLAIDVAGVSVNLVGIEAPPLFSGDEIAARIQAAVRAAAPSDLERPALANFTCAFVRGRYVLKAGAPLVQVAGSEYEVDFAASTVVVTGGSAAPVLELGVADGGVELPGSGDGLPARSVSAPFDGPDPAAGTADVTTSSVAIQLNGEDERSLTLLTTGDDIPLTTVANELETLVRAETARFSVNQPAYSRFVAAVDDDRLILVGGTFGAGSSLTVPDSIFGNDLRIGASVGGAFHEDGQDNAVVTLADLAVRAQDGSNLLLGITPDDVTVNASTIAVTLDDVPGSGQATPGYVWRDRGDEGFVADRADAPNRAGAMTNVVATSGVVIAGDDDGDLSLTRSPGESALDASQSVPPLGTTGVTTEYDWAFLSGPAAPTILDDDGPVILFDATTAGTYVFELTITVRDAAGDPVVTAGSDANGQVVREVTVEIVEGGPVADAGPDRTVIGMSAVLDGSGSFDPNGGPITYAWSAENALGQALTGAFDDPTLEQPTFAPTPDGAFTVTLTVTKTSDGQTAADSAAVVLTDPSDLLPVADAGPDLVGRVGEPVTLQGGASADPEGEPLDYSWETLSAPEQVSISDVGAATPSFTPSTSGTFVFELTVAVAGAESKPDTVTVTVIDDLGSAVQRAPAAVARAIGLERSVFLEDDPDVSSDDPPTFVFEDGVEREGSVVDVADEPADDPAPGDVDGMIEVRIVVGGALTATVYAPAVTGDEPLASLRLPSGAEAAVRFYGVVGEAFYLDGTQSQDDGVVAGFTWTQTGGPFKFATRSGELVPVLPQTAGTYAFELVVEDDFGLESLPRAVSIPVLPAGLAAPAGPPTAVAEVTGGATVEEVGGVTCARAGAGATVDLSAEASVSRATGVEVSGGGAGLTFAWEQVSGPTAALSDPASAETSAATTAPGPYRFDVTVTDANGVSARATVWLSVGNTADDAPCASLAAVADQVLSADTGTVEVTLDGLESEGAEPLSFLWSQTAGVPVVVSGDGTAVVTLDQPGRYTFTLRVVGADGVTSPPAETSFRVRLPATQPLPSGGSFSTTSGGCALAAASDPAAPAAALILLALALLGARRAAGRRA